MTPSLTGVQRRLLPSFAPTEQLSSAVAQTPISRFSRTENLCEILDLLVGHDGRSNRGIEDLLDWLEGRP